MHSGRVRRRVTVCRYERLSRNGEHINVVVAVTDRTYPLSRDTETLCQTKQGGSLVDPRT